MTAYWPDGTPYADKEEQTFAKFEKIARLSKYKSKVNGIPTYEDEVVLKVIHPGEKDHVVVLASEIHKMRFPKQWEAFQKGEDQTKSGTPLELLFPSEPGTVATLRAANVFTVQQLSNLTDTGMIHIPMARTLVERAKLYLNKSQEGAKFHDMQAQIDELKALLAQKNEEIPGENAAPLRKKPGPKPKNIEETV